MKCRKERQKARQLVDRWKPLMSVEIRVVTLTRILDLLDQLDPPTTRATRGQPPEAA